MLKSVLYISKLNKNISLEELKLMSNTFSKHNKEMEISGILTFVNDQIMQYIEGDSEIIDKLYISILKDPRHYDIITLFDERIDERIFTEWGLKLKFVDIKRMINFMETIHGTSKKNIISIFKSYLDVNHI